LNGYDILLRLGIALAAGLLVGVERGWSGRASATGTRVAGVRTFGLIGLLGGISSLIGQHTGDVVFGILFAAFAVVIVVARGRAARITGDYGATTIVAALVTFALGAVAMEGEIQVAAAGAVVVSLLLGVKSTVHHWVERIEYDDLLAVLKLLVMSVVLLPVLPDRGYGPYQALNPYELWLMVVLVAGVSLVGYVLMKAAKARQGLLAASMAAGLVSSTAVAVSYARLAKTAPGHDRLFAGAIVLASGIMFPRMLVVATAVNSAVIRPLALPLGLGAAAALGGAALLWRRPRTAAPEPEFTLKNPFEFGLALKFGLLLAVVMVASHALQAWLGNVGVFALSLLSGVADVDAITLTLSRAAGETVTQHVAAVGITIAAMTNTVVKAGIAWSIGGASIGRPAAAVLAAAVAAAALGLALQLRFGL
jgi:uncharacterized membrane protein (DUF4010 family)